MGRVFEAFRIGGAFKDHKSAVKVLDLSRSDDDRDALRDRFVREILIVRDLSGPHIVPVIDADEEADGTLWLAMKLIDGPNLEAYVKQYGALAPALAFELAAQVAVALQQAHELGIIHRDVKPSNLFLERLGPPPHVYLGDFGIGKIIEEELRAPTIDVRYTPAYAAPEQFDRRTVSALTDVFGLGRTLYTLLTGRVPSSQRPLDLDDLPPVTANLLRQATAREAARRPDMKSFEAQLRRLAAAPPPPTVTMSSPSHDPARAAPGGDPERRLRRRPERRAVVGVAVILMVLGAAIIAVSPGGRSPVVSETARVLVVVDLSEKMFCPQGLDGDICTSALIAKEAHKSDPRPTRIGQAKSFAQDGVAALRPRDEIGITTFYSTAGRVVLDTRLPVDQVRELAPSPTEARVRLAQTFAAIKGPASGGSPLRDAMAAGTDRLSRDAPRGGSVTNTLVILTDGNDNSSATSADQLRVKLSLADPTRAVRILVTAATEDACQPLLPIVEATDGDCFAAPTPSSLTCASKRIVATLRRPHPTYPRSHAEIVRDRVDC
jgi:serine/threonine protein kinase